jgi:drug/metabolite transporter (DMT)-like permease
MENKQGQLLHTDGIPFVGVATLVLLSLLWGGNMVSIKICVQGVPPILAAAIRSIVSSALLWIYAKACKEDVFLEGNDVKHGAAIGFLFGAEFLLIYWGATFTDVSRAIIFLYTQPLWVALAAHYLLSNDSLRWKKSVGLVMAFAGLVMVFGSKSRTLGPYHVIGDLMEVAAGILWAATTIYIKRFIADRPITHFQTLFAQLLYSIPLLAAGAFLFEWGVEIRPTAPVLWAMFYQAVIVAFASYLAWFWLIHKYQVSLISAFTFLTPLFGVCLSALILGEDLPWLLWLGFGPVALGIYLVTKPEPVKT